MRKYAPSYFLINARLILIQHPSLLAAGDIVLLRFVNAVCKAMP